MKQFYLKNDQLDPDCCHRVMKNPTDQLHRWICKVLKCSKTRMGSQIQFLRMSSGYKSETLSFLASTWQYPMASRCLLHRFRAQLSNILWRHPLDWMSFRVISGRHLEEPCIIQAGLVLHLESILPIKIIQNFLY